MTLLPRLEIVFILKILGGSSRVSLPQWIKGYRYAQSQHPLQLGHRHMPRLVNHQAPSHTVSQEQARPGNRQDTALLVERHSAATAAANPLPGAQLVGMAVSVPSAWGKWWQPVLTGTMVSSLSSFMPVSVSASQPSQRACKPSHFLLDKHHFLLQSDQDRFCCQQPISLPDTLCHSLQMQSPRREVRTRACSLGWTRRRRELAFVMGGRSLEFLSTKTTYNREEANPIRK